MTRRPARDEYSAANAPLSLRQQRCLFALLVVAAAVRVAWALYATRDAPVSALQSGDQYSYWYYGQELAAGRDT